MGVWGDEGGQSEPEAMRSSRVEERLESLRVSPGVDALRYHQQAPGK